MTTSALHRVILTTMAIAAVSSASWAQPPQQVSLQPGPQVPPPAATSPESAVALTLNDAIARALDESEEVRLARTQVEAAETRITVARSTALPQVNATTSYARTFQSPFTRGLDFEFPEGERFNPDPAAPLEQRVRYLEENADRAVFTTLADLLTTSLQDVGLGSPHAYAVNLSGSQLLYSGGRVGAALGIARNARDAAAFTFRELAADVEADVQTAYYRVLLAQELESIAEAALVQAESFLNQERLRLKAGFASDLDVMRAEVSLENLRPQLIDAGNARELALLDLKRLVNLPLMATVRLTTPLEIPVTPEPGPSAAGESLLAARPAVRAAERQVAAREEAVRAARAAYVPSVSLQVAYGGQIFPRGILDFDRAPWQPNGTATIAVQVPIFSGFARGADVGQAQIELRQAQLQTAQLRESIQLQYQQALGERERARASIAARQRTVEQAQRVYDLTVLRYEQGQATQLEVSDARLALLQSRTNLAEALSDYYIANAGVTRAVGGGSAITALAPPTAASPGGPPPDGSGAASVQGNGAR